MLGFKVVHQNCQGLVETLGKYRRTVDAGLHFYCRFYNRLERLI